MRKSRVAALQCLSDCNIKTKEQSEEYSGCRVCWAEAYADDPRLAPLRMRRDALQREIDTLNVEIATIIEETT